jgi:hypothetical protein
LECGHRIATEHKQVAYHCPDCEGPAPQATIVSLISAKEFIRARETTPVPRPRNTPCCVGCGARFIEDDASIEVPGVGDVCMSCLRECARYVFIKERRTPCPAVGS